MNRIARQFALVAVIFTAVSSARAADASLEQMKAEITARYNVRSDVMKDYVTISVAGFDGRAYQLADGAQRADNNQPGVLMFDRAFHLVAIGYSRPTTAGVEVMSLADFSIRHVDVVTTVAAR